MQKSSEEPRDVRIARLGRELAQAINESEGEGREFTLRSAIEELKESVDLTPPSSGSPADAGQIQRPLNPMALGIPACLAGAVLVFLFPLVGLALFLLGAVACLVGLVVALVQSRRRGRLGRADPAKELL